MPKKPSNFRVLYGVLAALILIRFLPFVTGTQWFWGVGQLTILPIGYVLAYTFMAAVALILPFMPQSEKWGISVADWFNSRFLDSNSKSKYIYRTLLVLIAGVAFTLFRMSTHFLGDGMTYLSNVASGSGHFVKWSEAGAMAVVMWVQEQIGIKNAENALAAFQIVSIASGLITTWFYFLIAKQISPDPAKRMLTFAVLFFSSTLLLFFGYVESYPVVWGPFVGYLYFSLKYSTEGKGLIPALICLVIAGILHLQIGMFVPAFGFLLLTRGTGYRIYSRFRIIILFLAGLVVLAAVVAFGYKYSSDIIFQNLFLFPFSGKPIWPEYAAFSPRHLSDMLNLFLLVYPVGLLLLVISLKELKRTIVEPTAAYLGLLTIGSLLFLLLVDPGLSMPRDWDLFCSCWIAPVLLLVYLIPQASTVQLRRLGISIALFSITASGTYLVLNLNQENSIAEVRQIVENNREKSFGTLSLVGFWYRTHGDTLRSDSIEQVRKVRYPNFYALRQAWTDMQAGKLDLAEKEFKTIPADRFNREYYHFLAELQMRRKQFDSAVVNAEMEVKLAPYYDLAYTSLAAAYFLSGKPDESMEALHRGYALNENSAPIMIGLAANFAKAEQYDSVIFWGDRAIEANPKAAQAYLYVAQALAEQNDHVSAHDYAVKYLEYGLDAPSFEEAVQQIMSAFPEIRDSIEKLIDSNQVQLEPAK